MCNVYDVSRFGYASWKRRGLSARAEKDAELITHLERVFDDVDGIYGSPKVHEALMQEGIAVGLNKVAKLMRENELKARSAIIYRSHVAMDRFYASLDNQIRDLDITGPNQVWLGDVTYLKVNDEPRYLATILDKYSRRIVGWSLSKRRDVKLSLSAFKHASKKRLMQPGMYFHSDRGTEYLGHKYRNWLKAHDVTQSVNRKGVMNDNAEMESFFRHFKTERVHRREFTTEKELRAMIIEYIGFYNRKRLHSSLDYMTPCQYEARMV